jgi:Arc/MetJ-type ribon-helix-helix transcriptional regulator
MTQVLNKTGKISISLPADLVYYLDDCIREHGLESRSEVVATALRAMRALELEAAYTAASAEWDSSEDAQVWDSALADGLQDTIQGKIQDGKR